MSKQHTRIREVERICGHHFEREELVAAAITHPSAIEGRPVSAGYERLEFLGDSILGAFVALYVYGRFPSMNEGELTLMKTSLVSGDMLSRVGAELGLANLIVMGNSELGTQGRGMHKALEDVYESLVGALYLDGGREVAYDFVARTLLIPYVRPELSRQPLSAKSRLQEVVQRDLRSSPTYQIVDTQGTEHEPVFTAVAIVDGRRMGRGRGRTKKEAEAQAAANALTNMGYTVDAGRNGLESGGGD